MSTLKRSLSACMSMPRLGFTDNFAVCFNVFRALDIPLFTQQGVFWEQAATRMMLERMAAGDEYMVFVDYDSLFNRQQLEELLRLMDVYTLDAVFPVQICRNSSRVLVEAAPGSTIDFNEEVSPVLSGHFGLTVLRLSSFRTFPQPLFWSTPNAEGMWEPGVGRGDADVNFWKVCHTLGMRVAQANWVRIGHMELRASWPLPDGRMMFTNANEFTTHGVPTACMERPSLGQAGGTMVLNATIPPGIEGAALCV